MKQAFTFTSKHSIDVSLTKEWSGNKGKFNSQCKPFPLLLILGYESDKTDRNVTENTYFAFNSG